MECNVGIRLIPSSKRSAGQQRQKQALSARPARLDVSASDFWQDGAPHGAIGAVSDFRRIIDRWAVGRDESAPRKLGAATRAVSVRPTCVRKIRARGKRYPRRKNVVRGGVGAEPERCYSSIVAVFRRTAEVVAGSSSCVTRRRFPPTVARWSWPPGSPHLVNASQQSEGAGSRGWARCRCWPLYRLPLHVRQR